MMNATDSDVHCCLTLCVLIFIDQSTYWSAQNWYPSIYFRTLSTFTFGNTCRLAAAKHVASKRKKHKTEHCDIYSHCSIINVGHSHIWYLGNVTFSIEYPFPISHRVFKQYIQRTNFIQSSPSRHGKIFKELLNTFGI